MTLAELALTVTMLAGLGLVASRIGLSAIPAYLLAGLLLGPNEPKQLSLIEPSEVTDFVAELGVVFLLFFLGLEFSLGRVIRSGRHLGLGGAVDLAINGLIGLAIGLAVFGASLGAVILAAAIYVSSSAIIVKGLIDFRRLADEEIDLVLAVLIFEDIVLALVLGLAGGGGGELETTLEIVFRALLFVTVALFASRYVAPRLEAALERLPRELFLLSIVAFVIGSAALADELGLSEAIGALAAGMMLAETNLREEIEDRFFSFRDLFAALFFFVFGLSVDVGQLSEVGWLVALAVAATVAGKVLAGYLGGLIGGFTPRQSLNAGMALIAHGEFTIILAQVAAGNPAIPRDVTSELAAFAGLYVLATATIGVVLMKESKRLGRVLFPAPKLSAEEV